MSSEIIERIKEFVKEKTYSPESKYGSEPYNAHFIPMVKRAKELAKIKGADEEIVEIAAWLHDLGFIIYGRENHHLTGVEIAEKKLLELNYSVDKIEIIKKCILNHRGSVNNFRESMEEQVIAEADALSNFDNVSGIFKAAFVYENLSQFEARDSVREKLKRKWDQLSVEGKKLVKGKYSAAMILFKGEEK